MGEAERIDESLRSIFLKVYADIPLNLRSEPILVIEEGPVSWNAAFIEVKNKTKKGAKILKMLHKLQII